MCPDNTMLVATKFQSRLIPAVLLVVLQRINNHFQGDANRSFKLPETNFLHSKQKSKAPFSRILCVIVAFRGFR